jgi:hypothetical protein
MQSIVERHGKPIAIRTDLGAIVISLELSRSIWLITSVSPGGGEKMSKHSVPAGDIGALMTRFTELRSKVFARTGKMVPIVVVQEAGLDGFRACPVTSRCAAIAGNDSTNSRLAMAAHCRGISSVKSVVSSIASNFCSSRSGRLRASGMSCLLRKMSRRQRLQQCCSASKASGRSSPPFSGRKGCFGTSTIGAKLLLTRASRRRPGRADRSIANKVFPKQATHDCEQRSSSSHGYGCVISRNRRSRCGLKNASSAMEVG